jgi:hypothetical protein
MSTAISRIVAVLSVLLRIKIELVYLFQFITPGKICFIYKFFTLNSFYY